MASTVSRYSNAKHWCTICKIFTQNDPKSIRMHEEGLKHLGAVRRRLEKAARIKDQQSGVNNDSSHQGPHHSERPDNEPEEIIVNPDEILGQYAVRGTIYFQGNFHEDLLLLPHSRCQVSLLDEDGEPGKWIPCKVLSFDSNEEAYVVEYQPEEPAALPVSVYVSAGDIRIVGPPPPVDRMQNWSQVVAPSSDAISEIQDGDDDEGPAEPPKVEYYKGVAVIQETNAAETLVDEPSQVTGEAKVVFKKRSRPSQQG